ncbi:MAG: hypothetical protein ABSC05_05225 [Candidatus Solibacter sp.]
MTVGGKFTLLEEQVFGPRSAVITSLAAGIRTTREPSNYPQEWSDGTGAFFRHFGDNYARHAAQNTARFVVSALRHEDPRYLPAASGSVLGRALHAVGFVFADCNDDGHRTLAVANFAGAAASGLVGDAYLPDGFRDATHTGQRALVSLASMAGRNLAQEFAPDITRELRRFHRGHGGGIPVWWKAK